MSDYYSGVRLQLELDELMDRYMRLQARLKDIDTAGILKEDCRVLGGPISFQKVFMIAFYMTQVCKRGGKT